MSCYRVLLPCPVACCDSLVKDRRVDLGFWRDLAVIWLALFCFIGLLVPVAIAVFAVKGMHIVIDRTPRYLQMAPDVSRQTRTHVHHAADIVATPVVQGHRRWTHFRARWQSLWARSR